MFVSKIIIAYYPTALLNALILLPSFFNTTSLESSSAIFAGISSGVISHYHPLDKLIELHDQKIALYERMLKEKDDVISRLEAFLKNK